MTSQIQTESGQRAATNIPAVNDRHNQNSGIELSAGCSWYLICVNAAVLLREQCGNTPH